MMGRRRYPPYITIYAEAGYPGVYARRQAERNARDVIRRAWILLLYGLVFGACAVASGNSVPLVILSCATLLVSFFEWMHGREQYRLAAFREMRHSARLGGYNGGN